MSRCILFSLARAMCLRAEEILIDAKIECKVVPTPVTDKAYMPEGFVSRQRSRTQKTLWKIWNMRL